ncbi:anaphase-promoting complex subunit CDC26 isoform X2 [Polypterus senegalus]|uniref:anaphase-promoting complex subunit CDC26 isoform X2 n=1 Tax=Polypterus senegalus TaxID=55291 RepID=UPI001962D6D0|nr:anaphase-promoting complex subunit CDC26 isoform X2 [Polypterus senegalus]
MLRRKPTRLELKLDDIEEFDSVKKELENFPVFGSNSLNASPSDWVPWAPQLITASCWETPECVTVDHCQSSFYS